MTALRLEHLLTHAKGFALETATPLQRAICRASDGVPLGKLWYEQEVRDAFGGVPPPEKAPKILAVLAAIRSGKTLVGAAKAVQASQTVSLEIGRLKGHVVRVGLGDQIRIPFLSTGKDQATQGFAHLRNNVVARPTLQKYLIGDPLTESLNLRHPSGKAIEVQVSAMAKAGASLISRWLASVIFDEAPRMVGSDDGVVSLDDAMTASAGRILPGGQTLLIGSPWAPFGPVYDLVQKYWGAPTEDVVIIRAPGPAMNPIYWTPERCEELQRRDPRAYRTDVLAEFADPEEALFSSVVVEECTREGNRELPWVPEHFYVAAMDPATRGNAWTLVLLECTGLGGWSGAQPTFRVALARQWIGNKAKPLSSSGTLKEIAAILQAYGLTTAWSDQYAADQLRELASQCGLDLIPFTVTADNRLKMAENINLHLKEGRLELPPDPQVRADLLQCRRRVTQNGVTLVLPKTGDGRHCDYVPALGLAMNFPPEEPAKAQASADEDFERALQAVETSDDWEGLFSRMQG